MSDWSPSNGMLPWHSSDEMWGAVSALKAARPGQAVLGSLRRHARLTTKVHASAGALHAEPYIEDDPSPIRRRLDYRPQLSFLQTALSFSIATGVCCAMYTLKHPEAVSVMYGLAMGALYAVVTLVSQAFILEREFSKRLLEESDLGGAHSKFRQLMGLKVHYTTETAASDRQTDSQTERQTASTAAVSAVHCYHGFGANSWSWSFTQRKLANKLGVTVTAHDMPGFGLTHRTNDDKAFSLKFNGQLGRSVCEAEAETVSLSDNLADRQTDSAVSSSGHASAQQVDQVAVLQTSACADEQFGSADDAAPHSSSAPGCVLIGHSLGAACVAAEAIQCPQGIKAIVLVAPAIMSVRLGGRQTTGQREDEKGRKGTRTEVTSGSGDARRSAAAHTEFSSNVSENLMNLVGAVRTRVARVAIALLYATLATLTRAAIMLATPLLVVILRCVVRSRGFWERGLARAWHRKTGVTQEVVDAYRLPQLVRGWERGMIAFLRARVAAERPFLSRLAAAYHGRDAMTQVEELLEVIVAHDIKVLIIHGECDALVPVANSRRLASILPGTMLRIVPGCGHNPQEELPDEFVRLVTEFMRADSKHQ